MAAADASVAYDQDVFVRKLDPLNLQRWNNADGATKDAVYLKYVEYIINYGTKNHVKAINNPVGCLPLPTRHVARSATPSSGEPSVPPKRPKPKRAPKGVTQLTAALRKMARAPVPSSIVAVQRICKQLLAAKKKPRKQLSKVQRLMLVIQQQCKCNMCPEMLDPEVFDADHVVPLGHGGGNELSNFQALCKECHGQKTNRERV